MKKFLVTYMGTAESFAKYKALEEKMRKERDSSGMAAWKTWMLDNKKSIVEEGSPIGKTKRVDKDGVSDMQNEIGAYVIVEAESHEAAAKLFLNHPHFMIFPGDRVEVMECLPMPQM